MTRGKQSTGPCQIFKAGDPFGMSAILSLHSVGRVWWTWWISKLDWDMQKPCEEDCCRVSCIWGRSAALAWERPLPPALITLLNVNKAGLGISDRHTCFFYCWARGPHSEPPPVLRDLHLSKQHSYILMTPFFPGIFWQDHLWGDAYVISCGGTNLSLPRLALLTKLILATPWLLALNSGQFPHPSSSTKNSMVLKL